MSAIYKARETFTTQLDSETVTVHAEHTRVSDGHPLLASHAEAFVPCDSSLFGTDDKLVAARRFGAMEFAGLYLRAAAQFGEPARFITQNRGGHDNVHDTMRGDPFRGDEPLPVHFPELFEKSPHE